MPFETAAHDVSTGGSKRRTGTWNGSNATSAGLERGDAGPEEIQAVMQDITPHKRAELAAKEAKATLEQMNRQLKRRSRRARHGRAGQPRQQGQERIAREHEPAESARR